jgi:diguanylate cyclase (GGDEF)-like protein/hemerythrin-like metal-binding protein/PAS domain S-box-containing protein
VATSRQGDVLLKFFYWNEKYETGEKTIDGQHRTLVDIINKLSTTISNQSESQDVENTLTFLLEYTSMHFRDEEAIMMASDLPEEEKNQHRLEHKAMAAEVHSRIQQISFAREGMDESLLHFLTTWLIKHILGSDMRMVDTLKGRFKETNFGRSEDNLSRVEQVLLNALNESESRFRFFTDSAPVMVWISDNHQNRTFFNKAWSLFAGEDIDLYQGQWRELIHPEDRDCYNDFLDNLSLESRNAECEYRIRRSDGEYRYLLERVMPRFETDTAFIGYISSSTDISTQKQSEQTLSRMNEKLEEEVLKRTREIESMLRTDPLTGIGNRRFLMESLDEELKRSDRYGRNPALLFIDIDHFKVINDNYGHGIGDQVLIKTAKALQKEVRNIDALGRFGGEEFLVILPETSLQGALVIAERMRTRVKNTKFAEIDHSISISIGVAERESNEVAHDLIKRADEALYRAKNNGRDQVQLAG